MASSGLDEGFSHGGRISPEFDQCSTFVAFESAGIFLKPFRSVRVAQSRPSK